MSDVDAALAVEISLRSGTYRAWTGEGSLSLAGVAQPGGSFVKVADYSPAQDNVRALEYVGARLYAGRWGNTEAALLTVDPATAAVTVPSGTITGFVQSVFGGAGPLANVVEGQRNRRAFTAANGSPSGASTEVVFRPSVGASIRRCDAAVRVSALETYYACWGTDNVGYLFRGGDALGAGGKYRPPLVGALPARHRIFGLTVDSGGDLLACGWINLGTTLLFRVWKMTPGSPVVLEDVVTDGSLTTAPQGIAVSAAGDMYVTTTTSLWRAFRSGGAGAAQYAPGAGIAQVELPNATEEDGERGLSISIAVEEEDKVKWTAPQGPVSVLVRQLVRAPGGDWTATALQWRGVLGRTRYVNGLWEGRAEPASASARHRLLMPYWSGVDQRARTDGRDTALQRMRASESPLPVPPRV